MLIPVKMLCVVSTDGRLEPVRFKLWVEDEGNVTIHVDRIMGYRADALGINVICGAVLRDMRRRFTLRYNLKDHAWKLVDMV